MLQIKLNKSLAWKMGEMIESGLITYKHYVLFCDEIIEKYENPPYWIIELSLTKVQNDAVRIVREFAHSEPFENFPEVNDFYLACLFLQYKQRQISWVSFLFNAGWYCDGYHCSIHCEFFYDLLNAYEKSKALEEIQVRNVENFLLVNINEAQDIYKIFEYYFDKYIVASS
ncbi:hypothetical protein [Lysinibacillus sphaericus]|uniref:hypothetical protein n=2 Tax=Lysinibacillus sphaericus TaxID=1421 RepID=UPI001A9D115C|nr:hypothetical protein [Lysinibacillus sphaericus]QTB24457.1 hypothetical protein J1907_10680 [Lysinibacillus sphaericus]QTB25256.1 hypothetical protein J2D51_12890 [Lysinibacillus sphaericus]